MIFQNFREAEIYSAGRSEVSADGDQFEVRSLAGPAAEQAWKLPAPYIIRITDSKNLFVGYVGPDGDYFRGSDPNSLWTEKKTRLWKEQHNMTEDMRVGDNRRLTASYRGAEVTLTEAESLRVFGILINANYLNIGEPEKVAAKKFVDGLTNHL